MIRISIKQRLPFRSKKLCHRMAGLIFDEPPIRKFGLKINTHEIGGLKSRFGRTPGMKPNMVEAIFFYCFIIFQPLIQLHWSISCKWENTSIMPTAEKGFIPVNDKRLACCFEFAQAKNTLLRIDFFPVLKNIYL